MACFFPVPAWRVRGGLKSDGKWPLTFREKEGWKETEIMVPCGKCIGCRADYARSWAVRCINEASMHEKNCCVTLTYDDNHLPSDGLLCKRDLQTFFKRLRKALGSFRYFGCGEYGSVGSRPHYHVLLFGLDFPDKTLVTRHCGEKFYDSKLLRRIWSNGHVTIGSVTSKSAAYVARYCLKKLKQEVTYDVAEFTTMSLKPGIGTDWLKRYKSDIVSAGACVSRDGIFSVPKFYEIKTVDTYEVENHYKRGLVSYA